MIERECAIENCEGTARRKGLCDKHYRRALKHGDPNKTLRVLREYEHAPSDGLCTIPDCENKYHSKGYCEMHYRRFKLHGDALKVVKSRTRGTAAESASKEPQRLDSSLPPSPEQLARRLLDLSKELGQLLRYYNDAYGYAYSKRETSLDRGGGLHPDPTALAALSTYGRSDLQRAAQQVYNAQKAIQGAMKATQDVFHKAPSGGDELTDACKHCYTPIFGGLAKNTYHTTTGLCNACRAYNYNHGVLPPDDVLARR